MNSCFYNLAFILFFSSFLFHVSSSCTTSFSFFLLSTYIHFFFSFKLPSCTLIQGSSSVTLGKHSSSFLLSSHGWKFWFCPPRVTVHTVEKMGKTHVFGCLFAWVLLLMLGVNVWVSFGVLFLPFPSPNCSQNLIFYLSGYCSPAPKNHENLLFWVSFCLGFVLDEGGKCLGIIWGFISSIFLPILLQKSDFVTPGTVHTEAM